MKTILPIGTTVCHDCKAPVAVVRRTAERPCDCMRDGRTRQSKRARRGEVHTHTVADVAWAVVDADGERHHCEAAA